MKYKKEQIEKAIAKWQKVLETMNEDSMSDFAEQQVLNKLKKCAELFTTGDTTRHALVLLLLASTIDTTTKEKTLKGLKFLKSDSSAKKLWNSVGEKLTEILEEA